MAQLSGIYANAIFDLWLESGEDAEYLEQAELLRGTLRGEDCRGVILNPRIPTAEKQAFFARAFDGMHDDLLGFVKLAIEKGRGSFIVPALDAFADMAERRMGKVRAKVIAARTLSERQIAALKVTLEKKLNKTVDITPEIDPSVIGGVYVYADGYVLDMTVRKRLRDMKAEMK